MVLPKNSGFQMGATSLVSPVRAVSGMKEISRVGEVGSCFIQALEVGPIVREEELAFRSKGAALDGDGHLADLAAHRRIEIGVFTRPRGRAGQSTGNQLGLGGVLAADQPETGRSGIDIDPGDAQAMVVIPDGGGTLGIVIADKWPSPARYWCGPTGRRGRPGVA